MKACARGELTFGCVCDADATSLKRQARAARQQRHPTLSNLVAPELRPLLQAIHCATLPRVNRYAPFARTLPQHDRTVNTALARLFQLYFGEARVRQGAEAAQREEAGRVATTALG